MTIPDDGANLMKANFRIRNSRTGRTLPRILPKTLAVAALGLTLASCGISPSTTPDGQVAFPALSRAWLPEGTFVNVQNLQQMRTGLSKNQVYALLGEPHFAAGVLIVHVWNYLFDFHQADGSTVQCQYQVQYDSHMLVKATYWRDARCEEFVSPRPAPIPAPAPAPVVQRVRLNGDVSFDTNQAALKPAARNALDTLIARSQGMTYGNVVVSGYTDARGSVAHNQGLSAQRAASVADYLRQHGLRAQHYEAHGYGASHPLATNATADGRAQNRRVEIVLEP